VIHTITGYKIRNLVQAYQFAITVFTTRPCGCHFVDRFLRTHFSIPFDYIKCFLWGLEDSNFGIF